MVSTNRLVFDIETEANPETLQFADEPKPNGSLRDPEKIAADIEAKKQALIDNAALDPDYGRILSIGYASTIMRPEPTVLVATKKGDEKEIIEEFWAAAMACNNNYVGYNILGFDLPYIMRRSMALGVRVPRPPFMAKYRTDPVTDLMGILFNWGIAKSLKQVAKIYGIPVPAEGVTGADVKNLTTPELIKYQRSDVVVTLALFDKMNGIFFDL